MIERALADHPELLLLLAAYGLALVPAIPGAFGVRALRRLGVVLLAIALVANTAVLVERWIEAGRAPFKTLYETMLFYPWCVALVTLVLIGMYRLAFLVIFAAAISLAGLGYALARPDAEIVNLPPALQSGWFVPHVVTYFISYAALFAGAVLALLSLLRRRPPVGLERPLEVYAHLEDLALEDDEPGEGLERPLEVYAHHAVVFGFVALTAGVLMGAIWGKVAWGDYWSWDPKENWALVTWLAYLAYLHLRFAPGWAGRRAMAALLVAFAAVVFTYLGMELLPTTEGSLHVYQ